MSIEWRFFGGLITTVVFLGLATLTGRARKRKQHLVWVLSAVVALGVTIVLARELGEVYDVYTAGAITPIHLTMAKVTTALFLLPITTGILTWKRGKVLRYHRFFAYLVLVMTVLTAGTGTAMILLAEKF